MGPRVNRVAHSEDERPQYPLGARIREIRVERGVGVRQLGRAIDCSASLISQIELGKVTPSVSTLYALSAALDVPIESFFVKEGVTRDAQLEGTAVYERAFVQRAENRLSINLERGVRWELLTPVPEDNVEFMEVFFDVGGGNISGPLTRHDGREYALVGEGTLGIQIGFEEYRLKAGDSLAFESTVPHRIWNLGGTRVRAVWLVLGRVGHREGRSFSTLHAAPTRAPSPRPG